MKKVFIFIATLFTLATVFAAARPSLDGRAVVADSGEMPRGLFARTIGYLPGDSVSVTNPATGSSVDVLILGAIDASEGVAILLSPEAADALNITKDSNVQVKITKRAGSLDEAVSGKAILAEDSDDLEVTTSQLKEEIAQAPQTPLIEENVEAIPNIEDMQEQPLVAEENFDNIPQENYSDFENVELAEVIPEETFEQVASAQEIVEEMPLENVPIEQYVVEDTEENVFALQDIIPEISKDTQVAEIPQEPVEIVEEIPVVVEEIAYEKVDETPIEFIEDAPSELVQETPIEIVEDIPYEKADEQIITFVETPIEDVSPVVEEIPPVVAEIEEVPEIVEPIEQVEPVEIVEIPVVEPMQSVIAEDIPEETEEYQPIVLVPADSNPPEEIAEVEIAEPVKNIEVAVEPVAPVEEIETPKVTSTKDYNSYITTEEKLEKGKWYIQVASLGKEANLNAFVEKYATKYPLAIISVNEGKTYRTLVGPLTMDEYGSVYEKFKAFGFKDAFLKKIK